MKVMEEWSEKIAHHITEVPQYVLENPKFYKLTEIIKKGEPVFTNDYERAITQPNFENLSQTIVQELENQLDYGPWSRPISGYAPIDLIEKKAAKQIEDKVEYFYGQKHRPLAAINLKIHYVEPIDPNLDIFTVEALEFVPIPAKAFALKHKEIHLKPAGATQNKQMAFPSEEKIPAIATKTKNIRAIPSLENEGEYEIEYAYEWSIEVKYPYSRVFDYEIHTPQYIKREVTPKKIFVTHNLYSFRHDNYEYHWVEKESFSHV
ncbi:MAG: hypothetical protein LBV67_01845 [Streptococcaceae bacterium]|jgi:hypothetical protein|nr:hypothetical protein [Streptococcaceae bacterium]